MKYRVAVCDDLTVDKNYISSLVSLWAAQRGFTVETDTFSSAEAFLFHYLADKNYDLLLLDIEMSGMDGVSLAKKVREDNKAVQIVF